MSRRASGSIGNGSWLGLNNDASGGGAGDFRQPQTQRRRISSGAFANSGVASVARRATVAWGEQRNQRSGSGSDLISFATERRRPAASPLTSVRSSNGVSLSRGGLLPSQMAETAVQRWRGASGGRRWRLLEWTPSSGCCLASTFTQAAAMEKGNSRGRWMQGSDGVVQAAVGTGQTSRGSVSSSLFPATSQRWRLDSNSWQRRPSKRAGSPSNAATTATSRPQAFTSRSTPTPHRLSLRCGDGPSLRDQLRRRTGTPSDSVTGHFEINSDAATALPPMQRRAFNSEMHSDAAPALPPMQRRAFNFKIHSDAAPALPPMR